MAVICPTCSRGNPGDALFCYHDGMALGDERPVRPSQTGSTPFSAPFVFPGGLTCRNFNELAFTCQTNWSTARSLLTDGVWPVFFDAQGRNDLAEAARRAALEPDPDRALSQFLQNLPADVLLPPRLDVEKTSLNLQHLVPGKDDIADIVLTNRGMLLLHGVVTVNGDWLAFDDVGWQTQKIFQTTGETCISVRILGHKLRAAKKPMEAEIVIDSNGGNVRIPVRAEIPIHPFPDGVLAGATSPREIAAKAKIHPKEAATLFVDGAVKAWYERNGWTYPIEAQASGVGAVQQFYEVLGLVKPPHLTIDAEYLSFTGKSGEIVKGQIVLSGRENLPVFAVAESNRAWLTLGAVKAKGNKATIPLDITTPALPGETLEGAVTIVGNGNRRFKVSVHLTVAAKVAAAPTMMPAPVPPSPVAPPPAPYPTAAPKTVTQLPPTLSTSGKRLTTLVRETVEEAVSQKAPRTKWINELSVLALTMGLIALAITWPFALAGVGILLGAVATIASAAALWLVMTKKTSDFTLPALAGLVSVQALVMAIILLVRASAH